MKKVFIVTANIYPTQALDQPLMSSLLASILILDHYKYNKGNLLEKMPIGFNLSLLDGGTVTQVVQAQSTNEDCRWVGIEIAAYWERSRKRFFYDLLNYAKWKEYAFCSIEKKLVRGNYDLSKDNYNIFHICYLINQKGTEKYNEIGNAWIEPARKLLEEMNIETETHVETVLTTFEKYLNVYDSDILKQLFTMIEIQCKYKRSSGNSQFVEEYNEHLEHNTPLGKTS